MIIKLKINGTEIDPVDYHIRISSIQLYVFNGQPQMDFSLVTPVMKSPSSLFDFENAWTYNAKEIEVIGIDENDSNNRHTLFLGDIRQVVPNYRQNSLSGYSLTAIGYGWRAEQIPIINPYDLSGQITFNPDRKSFDYDSIYDGKNLGDTIRILLTGTDTAQMMHDAGFTGMYASLGNSSSPATLSKDFSEEINVLSSRPTSPISYSGENIYGSIQSILEAYNSNYRVIADPNGRRLKIYDTRNTQKKTFVLGQDKIDTFTHNRDVSTSYKSVTIRGSANVRPYVAHWNLGVDSGYPLGFKTGNLVEDFGYGKKTNAQAKSDWKLGHYENQVVVKADTGGIFWPSPGFYEPCLDPQDASCKYRTMPGTDQIEITTAFTSHPETDMQTGVIQWEKDEWAQTTADPNVTARQGRITIRRVFRFKNDSAPYKKGDIAWQVEDRFLVVGNDPYPNMLPTCDGLGVCAYDKIRFTLDRDHGVSPSDVHPPDDIQNNPILYDEEWSFELTGYNPSGAVVWRKYALTFGKNTQKSSDRGVTRKIMKTFPQPVPWRSADGSSVVMVTSPQAALIWSKDYKKPFFEWPLNFYIDRESNTIIFSPPVVRAFGTRSKLETGGFNNALVPPWDPTQVIDGTPYDIRVLLPVADGIHSATYPDPSAGLNDQDAFGNYIYGTAARCEGVTRSLRVSIPSWVRLSDSANMDDYARQIYDSVKNTIVHGQFDILEPIDPWSASWHPYWLLSRTLVDGDSNTYESPMLQSVNVEMLDSVACDSGLGVLPEEELIFRQVDMIFPEGSGGKGVHVKVQYTNQKSPWTSPQFGFDFFSQMISADSQDSWMDFQRYAGPIQ